MKLATDVVNAFAFLILGSIAAASIPKNSTIIGIVIPDVFNPISFVGAIVLMVGKCLEKALKKESIFIYFNNLLFAYFRVSCYSFYDALLTTFVFSSAFIAFVEKQTQQCVIIHPNVEIGLSLFFWLAEKIASIQALHMRIKVHV